MKRQRILFLVAHPPRRGALAFELLDELLVGAVFEQSVSVLFVDDGVFQLIDGAGTQGNVARGYRALPTYDINEVYVDQLALRRRGLDQHALVIPTRSLTRRAIQGLVAAQDVVLSD